MIKKKVSCSSSIIYEDIRKNKVSSYYHNVTCYVALTCSLFLEILILKEANRTVERTDCRTHSGKRQGEREGRDGAKKKKKKVKE